MAGQRKKQNKNKRGGSHGNDQDLKNSVILMLILLCIFFATRTDVWLADCVQTVFEYVGISTDSGMEEWDEYTGDADADL